MSIKGYLSAIRHLQRVKGMGDPFATAMPLLEYALRGVNVRQSRTMSTRGRRRLPITPDMLRKLKSVWERTGGDVNHIMLWAACCTCFYGFLRSEEATVPSTKEYDREGHLSEGDVAIDSRSNPTVVRVHIKAPRLTPSDRECSSIWKRQGMISAQWRKLWRTWQLGAGRLAHSSVSGQGHHCPVNC